MSQDNGCPDEVREALAALASQVSALTHEMRNGVSSRLTAIEGRLSNVEGRLTSVEGRMGGFETKLDDLETKLDDVRTYVIHGAG